MACGCEHDKWHLGRPAQYPPNGGKPYHNQSPTFLSREVAPCGKPMFIPNQPPVPPRHGCCHNPVPAQAGPWEYIPSREYPDPHIAYCKCSPPGPYIPNQPMPVHGKPPAYECLPKQGHLPCRHHFDMSNPPRHGVPPLDDPFCDVKSRRCARQGDPNHPSHYPGLIQTEERPEPYYGPLKIISAVPTTDNEMISVQYSDGRYDMIALGYMPDDTNVSVNGPKCMPWDDIRGSECGSEGMDSINYEFNNNDIGATF